MYSVPSADLICLVWGLSSVILSVWSWFIRSCCAMWSLAWPGLLSSGSGKTNKHYKINKFPQSLNPFISKISNWIMLPQPTRKCPWMMLFLKSKTFLNRSTSVTRCECLDDPCYVISCQGNCELVISYRPQGQQTLHVFLRDKFLLLSVYFDSAGGPTESDHNIKQTSGPTFVIRESREINQLNIN